LLNEHLTLRELINHFIEKHDGNLTIVLEDDNGIQLYRKILAKMDIKLFQKIIKDETLNEKVCFSDVGFVTQFVTFFDSLIGRLVEVNSFIAGDSVKQFATVQFRNGILKWIRFVYDMASNENKNEFDFEYDNILEEYKMVELKRNKIDHFKQNISESLSQVFSKLKNDGNVDGLSYEDCVNNDDDGDNNGAEIFFKIMLMSV